MTKHLLLDSQHRADRQDVRPRSAALSWMTSIALAAGHVQAAQGYLLELVAFCTFSAPQDGAR